MKRKILAIVLTAMLVASMALTTIPAAALTLTSVAVTPNTISSAGQYTIKFMILPPLSSVTPDKITIQFPTGTTVPAAYVAGSVTVQQNALAAVPAVTVDYNVTLLTAAITVPADLASFDNVTVVFTTASGVVNPTAPGSYTLKVKTTREDTYVESAAYTIATPGFVQRFNSAGNLVGSFNTIKDALAAAAAKDVIKVAPGNYTDALTLADGFDVAEVSIESTGSKADTTITAAIDITAIKVKIDDFTLKGAVTIGAADVTIMNCDIIKASSTTSANPMVNVTSTGFIFKDSTVDSTSGAVMDTGVMMVGGSTGTFTNVTFKVDEDGTLADDKAIDVGIITALTVDKCTFTGASGIGYNDAAGATGVTIKNSTFDTMQIGINVSNVASVVTIQGNTFKNGSLDTAAAIDVNASMTVKIEGNTFSDNKGYSVDIDAANLGAVTAIGNSFTNNAKGFRNLNTTNDTNAKLNWWGNVAGPTIDTVVGGDKVSADVVYKPFATAAIANARSMTTVANTVATLDAQTSAGVIVSNVTTVNPADVLVARYGGNPKTAAPPNTPIATGYFDVYTSAASSTEITAKFYTAGITAGTKVYFWSGLTQSWQLCSNQGPAGTGEYAYVIIKPASATTTTTPNTGDLTGTIFALVNAPIPTTPPATPATPTLLSPISGAANVSISPTFAWTSVGTPYYEFQLAKDPGFVEPIADALKLDVPYFAYGGALDYGAIYYWQVRGSMNRGTSRCSGAECGAWAQGIFTTMEAPPPPTTPIPPTTTQIVIPPPPPSITPAWIYVIIGIGAALVIAVIVLIVTTRRAAP